MSSFRNSAFRLRIAVLVCALFSLSVSAASAGAQADSQSGRHAPEKAAANAQPPAEKPTTPQKSEFPPLPPPAHIEQSIQLDGKTLNYIVTVAALPVRDNTGKVVGKVVTTAYTVAGPKAGQDRPVIFAINGGPGASSAFLNLGNLCTSPQPA